MNMTSHAATALVSRLPGATLIVAHRKHFGNVPATKTDAVAAFSPLVAAGVLSIDNIKAMGGQWVEPEPTLADGAVASVAGRADSNALDALQKVDALRDDLGKLREMIQSVETQGVLTLGDLRGLKERVETVADNIIKVDGSTVSEEIRTAVDTAFKPIRAAAEANGTVDEVIAASGQATIVGRDTCLNVFGIEVLDAKGNPVEVDLWNGDAPPVDPGFIWTAEILKPLVLGQTGLNLWFGGEKGTGKTQTAMQFAARTGRPFTRYNFRKFTTSEDFLGATGLSEGTSHFKPGPVLQAYTTPGSVILLDEVTATDPGELIQLNGLLEEGVPRVNIGGTTWVKGQGVMVIAADNTLGSGDNSGRYAGTRMMNSALLDRFALVVPFKFLPPDEEERALVNITGCSPVMASMVVSILTVCRAKAESGDLVDAPSIRCAVNFIRAVPIMGVRDAWNLSIAARQPAESAVALEAIYSSFVDEGALLQVSR